MFPETESQILALEAHHYLPRQIARRLGLRVEDVQAVLRRCGRVNEWTGEQPPLARCLVNRTCARSLLTPAAVEPGNGLSDRLGAAASAPPGPLAGIEADRETAGEPELSLPDSLGLVLVARFDGENHFWVCTYLIDYCCLGVKDTLGPRPMASTDYEGFVSQTFSSFREGYQDISLRQAQAIVLGAASYALKLGFQPCREFGQTRSHLGDWDGEPVLQFGYQGKPFYINGPYDNPRQVLRTLAQTVGPGNFEYILGIG